MNDFIYDGSEGRAHLNRLIAEAEQERFVRAVEKAQNNGSTLSRIKPVLRKALETIRR